MRTSFESLNSKSGKGPTASSTTPSYVFIVMDNKLKKNNMKWTFSLPILFPSQPGGDHAPTLETHLGSAVLRIFSWQFAMPKWNILNWNVQV